MVKNIELNQAEVEMIIAQVADGIRYSGKQEKLILATNLLGRLGKMYEEFTEEHNHGKCD